MRIQRLLPVVAFLVMTGLSLGQAVPNGTFSSLAINNSANSAIGQPVPTTANVFTDSPISVQALALGNTPMLVIYSYGVATNSSISINSFSQETVQLDLADTQAPGFMDQILVNGYEAPWPTSYTDATGLWNASFMVPACTFSGGVQTCVTNPSFEFAAQAIVNNPLSLTGISSTGTIRADFTNGYTLFPFSSSTSDQVMTYNFPAGFVFNFYGTPYTSCFVSENAAIRFGSSSGLNFPNPTWSSINSTGPMIMSYFTDLDFGPFGGTTPRIYAQAFTENNVRKIKFVHENIQEFGNSTGPHGGEITITESGDIAVFVAGYNTSGSINTGVGIVAGPHPPSQFPSPAFGRDLSADIGGTVVLGQGFPGAELFDLGGGTAVNPLDLIGVEEFNPHGVGKGITYLVDPAASPFTNGYIIQ